MNRSPRPDIRVFGTRPPGPPERCRDALPALLAKALAELGAPADVAPRLRYTPRPRLPAPYDLSVSHSGGWLVCAVARHACVGVDIERIGDAVAADFPHYFTPEERRRAGDSAAACYRLWTRKEAVAKGDGGGLVRVPAVRVDGDRATLDGAAWSLLDFAPDGDTTGCLAVRQPHGPLAAPEMQQL